MGSKDNVTMTYKQLVPTLDRFAKELDEILTDINILRFYIREDVIKEQAMKLIYGDLNALVREDPSVQNSDLVAWETKGFEAVRYYRYLHTIYKLFNEWISYENNEVDEDTKKLVTQKIRKHSELAKNRTGVEIHPAAEIGENFIIDHGTGTVIGERTHIGNNCMILNDVILGSAFDPTISAEDRHPTLLDNVKVYSGARILGNIVIGNGCVIGTKCIVKKSIPDNTVVSIVNQLQLSRGKGIEKIAIYGIVPENNNKLLIYGKNLPCGSALKIEVVSDEDIIINNVNVKILDKSNHLIKICIKSEINLKGACIKIYDSEKEVIIRNIIALLEIGG